MDGWVGKITERAGGAKFRKSSTAAAPLLAAGEFLAFEGWLLPAEIIGSLRSRRMFYGLVIDDEELLAPLSRQFSLPLAAAVKGVSEAE